MIVEVVAVVVVVVVVVDFVAVVVVAVVVVEVVEVVVVVVGSLQAEYVIKNQTKPHLRNYSFLHIHFLTTSQIKLLIP